MRSLIAAILVRLPLAARKRAQNRTQNRTLSTLQPDAGAHGAGLDLGVEAAGVGAGDTSRSPVRQSILPRRDAPPPTTPRSTSAASITTANCKPATWPAELIAQA